MFSTIQPLRSQPPRMIWSLLRIQANLLVRVPIPFHYLDGLLIPFVICAVYAVVAGGHAAGKLVRLSIGGWTGSV